MSDDRCYYCKSQPCGCYAKFDGLVEPLGGKGELTVSDEKMQGWMDKANKRLGETKYHGVDHQAQPAWKDVSGNDRHAVVGGYGSGKALGDERGECERSENTSVFARWERLVQQAKEAELKRQATGNMSVATNPWWNTDFPWELHRSSVKLGETLEDEGAGCSDEEEFIPPPPPATMALGRTVLIRRDECEGLDERGFRRLLSEKMQVVGDEIMAIWRRDNGGR